MSYSTDEGIKDAQELFEAGLECTDYTQVYYLATKLMEIPGWEEEAEMLKKQATQLRNEDCEYDETKDNQ